MPPQGRQSLDDLRGSLDDLADTPPPALNGRGRLEDLAEEAPAWKRYLAMGLRGGGSLVGAGLGGFLGSVIPGAGTAAGAVVGGGLGGGAGEWLAEKLEGRKASPWEIAAQAGIGLTPLGKGAGLLKVAGRSAIHGAVGSAAESYARHGGLDGNVGEILRDTAAGSVIGGGVGAAAHTLLPFASKAVKGAKDTLRGEAADAPQLAAIGRPSKPGEAPPEVRLSQSRGRGSDLSDLRGETPGAHGPETPTFGAITPREQVAGMTPERVVSRMPRRTAGAVEAELANEPALPFQRRLSETEDLRTGPAQEVLETGLPRRRGVPESTGPRRSPSGERADTTDLTTAGDEPFTPYEPQRPLGPLSGGGGDPGLAAARQPSLFRPPPPPAAADEVDDLVKGLGTKGELELRGDDVTTLNASGESSASIEALNRQRSMQDKGQTYVVFDRTGQKRPIIGPDAVDYKAQPGETYGIEGPNGFQKLDDNGGRVPASQKTYVPAEIFAAHRDLQPRWAQTLEETGVDMREDLLNFNKRVTGEPNPRKLMGAERKAVRLARERNPFTPPAQEPPPISSPPAVQQGGFADKLKAILGNDRGGGGGKSGEAGFISPELAQRMGEMAVGGAVGGVAGAATGNDETRGRNAAGGALLGALTPAALRNPEVLQKLRYFGMLGSTGAQTKNLVGNAGSIAVKAAELAMSGDTEGAGRLLGSVFHRDTADAIMEAFKHAPTADTRWGSNSGALGTFSRIMHAVDEGVTSRAMTGGLTEEEAKLALHTSAPRSKTGEWVSSRPGVMTSVMPFARTAANVLERGLEHTPVVGLLPSVRAMRPESTGRQVASRQILGLMAALGGGALEGDRKPGERPSAYLAPALGPLALPFAAGTAVRKALKGQGKSDPGRRVGLAAVDALRDALPLPTDAYDFDPGRYLASYVPGVLGDASLVDPRKLDQTQSLLDPAIAKIPILNESLLRRKSVRRQK